MSNLDSGEVNHFSEAQTGDDIFFETETDQSERRLPNRSKKRVVDICYESKIPRNVFSCSSDESALLSILKTTWESINCTENEAQRKFVGVDEVAICSTCSEDIVSEETTAKLIRNGALHTLHYGTINIAVTDFVCGLCGLRDVFDGLSDGIFCFSKKHVCARELVDMWLWDICGTGGTFRDVYTS